jgi:hypothetical protein
MGYNPTCARTRQNIQNPTSGNVRFVSSGGSPDGTAAKAFGAVLPDPVVQITGLIFTSTIILRSRVPW